MLPGMEHTGNIKKMEASAGEVIQYILPLGETKVAMNDLLGTAISIEYLGKINCIRCGREIRKSFAQGYCYPCFTTAPETEECVLRPELCRAHEGIARDMDYAATHCLTDQVVYLSLTSGMKVGVTRVSQVPIRWIDQGAIRAIEFARTPNRHTAGLMEVAMKEHIADKTNWRKMLADSDPGDLDLLEEKRRLSALLPPDLAAFVTNNNRLWELKYPVNHYPEKIKSLNLDIDPFISGILTGIKGQYLMLDGNWVINIRNFGGYLIRIKSEH
jgi:hypothetical protein